MCVCVCVCVCERERDIERSFQSLLYFCVVLRKITIMMYCMLIYHDAVAGNSGCSFMTHLAEVRIRS